MRSCTHPCAVSDRAAFVVPGLSEVRGRTAQNYSFGNSFSILPFIMEQQKIQRFLKSCLVCPSLRERQKIQRSLQSSPVCPSLRERQTPPQERLPQSIGRCTDFLWLEIPQGVHVKAGIEVRAPSDIITAQGGNPRAFLKA